MFSGFLYTLRRHEMNVALSEWLTLMSALDKGLANNSLSGFYYLSRAILVKTEQEFDNFDAAFLEYFKHIREQEQTSPDAQGWLSQLEQGQSLLERLRSGNAAADSSQASDSIPGGTLGVFSDGGGGIGALGEGGGKQMVGSEMARSAFDLAGSRTFRDFRDDAIINERQYQVILRRLRQLSSHVDVPESELDIDATIRKTSNKGGILHVVMKKPRRNTVKLLLLMDSGGSMQSYSRLCTALFKAAMKSNSFQDLKIYYFHNCIYNNLYTDPTCTREVAVSSEWVLRNVSSEYKTIIVGDGAMAPAELSTANYAARPGEPSLTGMEWMKLFKKKYRKIIWLNPEDESYNWKDPFSRQWLAQEFDMYVFTLRNFEIAMKKLLTG